MLTMVVVFVVLLVVLVMLVLVVKFETKNYYVGSSGAAGAAITKALAKLHSAFL